MQINGLPREEHGHGRSVPACRKAVGIVLNQKHIVLTQHRCNLPAPLLRHDDAGRIRAGRHKIDTLDVYLLMLLCERIRQHPVHIPLDGDEADVQLFCKADEIRIRIPVHRNSIPCIKQRSEYDCKCTLRSGSKEEIRRLCRERKTCKPAARSPRMTVLILFTAKRKEPRCIPAAQDLPRGIRKNLAK